MISKATNFYETIWKQKIGLKRNSLCNRLKEAIKEVDSGYNYLDIGCGNGLFCNMVKKNYRYVYGIDCSNIAVRNMINHGTAAILADLDGNWLPVQDNAFDLVSCLDVIEHVLDPESLVREIYRVLKKNGIIILTTPNIRFIDFIRSLLFYGQFPKTSQDRGFYDGGHLHYFTFKDIKTLLIRNGFHIIKERGFDRKKYYSPKIVLFKMILRYWEKNLSKEFFCSGILFKAKKL